jgi:DNA-3-methyladenine glycosylase II
MRKAIKHLKASDPVLAGIIARVGPLRMKYPEPTFESLARSIVFQQLNGKAATAIFQRLVAVCNGEITPRRVLRLDDEGARSAGVSPQKLRYLRDLAARTVRREINFDDLGTLSDDRIIEHLTAVKGVGVWTAQMFLMFSLQRPDVLPTADYGLRAALKRAYNLAELPKPDRMEALAHPWRPYRTIACWYLWRSLDA